MNLKLESIVLLGTGCNSKGLLGSLTCSSMSQARMTTAEKGEAVCANFVQSRKEKRQEEEETTRRRQQVLHTGPHLYQEEDSSYGERKIREKTKYMLQRVPEKEAKYKRIMRELQRKSEKTKQVRRWERRWLTMDLARNRRL